MQCPRTDGHLSARDLLWEKGHGNLEGGSNRGGSLGLHLMNEHQLGLLRASVCCGRQQDPKAGKGESKPRDSE